MFFITFSANHATAGRKHHSTNFRPSASATKGHPLPDKTLDTNQDLLPIEVSPDVAFTVLLRHYRISHRLTQDTVSRMLRFKNRNSYVKLETAGNPTLRTVGKIRETFPDFPLMECF